MREEYIEKKQREINESRCQAWHIAHWILHRDIPDLGVFLVGDAKKPDQKRQTDNEMLAKARLLNALFGGTEVTA